jgi:peptide/nickel transport system substrate-binding protein
MLNEDHPYHDTGPFPLSFFFSAVEERRGVDEMEVTFTLNAPYAPFLSNLAYPTGLIVSPAAVMEHGRTSAATRPAPALHLHRMALERGRGDRGNPDYWDGAPELRGRGLPPDHRRQHPHRRDAGGRHRRDGRGAARVA